MRITFLLLTVLGAALLVAFPGIDLAVSRLFWTTDQGFVLADAWWARLVYHAVTWLVVLAVGGGLLVLGHNLLRRRPLGPLTTRRTLYLLLALALGPGLVVNVAFKDQFGRARPREVTEFGGDSRFTPALAIADQCDTNCSFTGGHPAAAFLLAGVAFLDRRRRRLWMATGIAAGLGVGLVRMAQGAHFLSDVVFSGLVVLGVCYLLARYVFRFEGISPVTGASRRPGGPTVPALLLAVAAGWGMPAPAKAQQPTSGGDREVARAPAAGETSTNSSSPAPIRLIAVGDIMMGTAYPGPETLDPALRPDADPAERIGSELASLLRGGDAVFGNLEGALFDGDGETKRCGNPELCYSFRSPPWYAGILAELGFNLVSLANNHSGDFREAGRAATEAALRSRGIAFAGLDRPDARTATLTLDDGTVLGLAAFAPNRGTVSIHDVGRAKELVRDLSTRCDVVIVSFHGGAEGAAHTHVPKNVEVFHGERRGDVHAFAHAVVDAGADLVIGHGPHVPRAIELYDGALIAYSLGNFWTYGRFNLRGPNGLAPVLEARLDRDGRFLGGRIHSAVQEGLGGPRLDPAGRAAAFIARLTAEDFPESGDVIGKDGTIGALDRASDPRTEGGDRSEPQAKEKEQEG